jgi:FlaA1/EpsC-like NDP-sugar epimerase
LEQFLDILVNKVKFTRSIRNRYLLVGDLLLISISVLLSFQLRLEFVEVFLNYYRSVLWMIGLSLLIRPIIYYYFGLYRRMWVYASIQELKSITIAVTLASALISAIMLVLFANRLFLAFPRSVLIIDWIIEIIFTGGSRFFLRLLAESRSSSLKQNNSQVGKRVLIIGAGDAGALVVKEMQRNPQLNLFPIGFLDDNHEKLNQQIHGIPVIGGLNDLEKIIIHKKINEVIISIPSAPGRVVRIVTVVCQKLHIPFRTMPGIYELLGGKVSMSRLREVDISDLLRREPVRFKEEIVGSIITGRVVMVTGAGGSIGSELCRQIARWNPKQLILLGHGENSIFEAYLEQKENYPALKTETVIADIRDEVRLDQEIKRFQPYVVFHAAAHKHVPLMEKNIEECIDNNILGTQNVLKTCLRNNVERLILISTDKAIRPANVMGATKRIAEMLVLDAAQRTGKAYSVVRFGNVLGSRGSVVPLFKHQIAHGGPVTVTHKDMQRYFMTIPEAVYLVLQAASMGKGGETFVLNMGEQIKIVDLARDLIRLSGLEPDKDIEIVFTGMRKGEKLSEDLWNQGRKFSKTDHPEIFCEEGQDELHGKDLQSSVRELLRLAEEGQSKKILNRLEKLIPGAEKLNSHEHALSDFDS